MSQLRNLKWSIKFTWTILWLIIQELCLYLTKFFFIPVIPLKALSDRNTDIIFHSYECNGVVKWRQCRNNVSGIPYKPVTLDKTVILLYHQNSLFWNGYLKSRPATLFHIYIVMRPILEAPLLDRKCTAITTYTVHTPWKIPARNSIHAHAQVRDEWRVATSHPESIYSSTSEQTTDNNVSCVYVHSTSLNHLSFSL
jgi:hypothetical protein